jgi:hypothetical protein
LINEYIEIGGKNGKQKEIQDASSPASEKQ